MTLESPTSPLTHIARTDWANLDLPDTWPDRLNWHNPLTVVRLLRQIFNPRRSKVQLPEQLPTRQEIPKYILQEFHNLPNGNYSKSIAQGYARWFDRVMLGTMKHGRARVAHALRGSSRILDLGCGAGHMAATIKQYNQSEVWGLDASPYLLQYAANTHHNIHWLHGLAEDTRLPDSVFDGISACFVLHEIPPRYLHDVMAEWQRIMCIGGRVAILEPSDVQWYGSWRKLWRDYGWRGVYFKWLANRVYEPFAEAWHKQDLHALFAEYGFKLETDEHGCPFRFVVATKIKNVERATLQ